MRAAQYVRMSTEHQQYSIPNQIAAISEYAKIHGLEVVRTYSDEGRSGVDLAHRPGLRQLLDDVISRSVDFSAVLVLDVSRWGRFQDTDESAHYEFLCKQAGIRVHYCAEQFPADDSILGSLFKAVKRTMAGEFSRELSAKTFAGQKRLTLLGFKMGGEAIYGLRRMLVDANRIPLRELGKGEWKYLATQRVIFVPGPEHEQDTVRSVFSMYLEEDLNAEEIAQRLNQQKVARHNGYPWTKYNVGRILTDPRYAGYAVFARCSKKFRSKQKVNPRSLWIMRPNAYTPIIAPEIFDRAEKKRLSKARLCSNEQLLQQLRDHVQKNGTLSCKDINSANHLPSAETYFRRFGSLWKAYELAGLTADEYPSMWTHPTRTGRFLRVRIAEEFRAAMVASELPYQVEGMVYVIRGSQPFLFNVAKCLPPTKTGELRWDLYSRKGKDNMPWAIARLKPGNCELLDWALLRRYRKPYNASL